MVGQRSLRDLGPPYEIGQPNGWGSYPAVAAAGRSDRRESFRGASKNRLRPTSYQTRHAARRQGYPAARRSARSIHAGLVRRLAETRVGSPRERDWLTDPDSAWCLG